jgi:hypothetical protein
MENVEKLEIELNQLIYQNFLIEICRICDEIYLREQRVVDLTFSEKEELAYQAFEFLAQLLEEASKLKKDFFVNRKKFGVFCKVVNKMTHDDLFCKYYLFDSILKGKLDKNFRKHLAIAVLKVLEKSEKSFDTRNIDKNVLRVAVIISPLVRFSEILKREIKRGNAKIYKKNETAEELLKYIG